MLQVEAFDCSVDTVIFIDIVPYPQYSDRGVSRENEQILQICKFSIDHVPRTRIPCIDLNCLSHAHLQKNACNAVASGYCAQNSRISDSKHNSFVWKIKSQQTNKEQYQKTNILEHIAS
jgi:hypothetical protein